VFRVSLNGIPQDSRTEWRRLSWQGWVTAPPDSMASGYFVNKTCERTGFRIYVEERFVMLCGTRRRWKDGRCVPLRSFLIPTFHSDERANDDGRRQRSCGHNIRFSSRRKGDGDEAQSTVWFKVSGRRSFFVDLLQLICFLFFKDRFLTDDQNVWTHNAWDRVPPPDDQDEIVAAAMAKQRSLPVPEEEKAKVNAKPSRNWYLSRPEVCKPYAFNTRAFRDNFYKNNANNFFRNRNWCSQSTHHASC